MSSKSPLKSVNLIIIKVSSNIKQQISPAFDPNVYATKNLPVDDVLKLKECFDIFDYDKSGNVSS
jgi:hypothetical protein